MLWRICGGAGVEIVKSRKEQPLRLAGAGAVEQGSVSASHSLPILLLEPPSAKLLSTPNIAAHFSLALILWQLKTKSAVQLGLKAHKRKTPPHEPGERRRAWLLITGNRLSGVIGSSLESSWKTCGRSWKMRTRISCRCILFRVYGISAYTSTSVSLRMHTASLC
jgi:hypothetical protein